ARARHPRTQRRRQGASHCRRHGHISWPAAHPLQAPGEFRGRRCKPTRRFRKGSPHHVARRTRKLAERRPHLSRFAVARNRQGGLNSFFFGSPFKTGFCVLDYCPKYGQRVRPRRQARRSSMASLSEWKVPPAFQPHAGEYGFDLDRALSSVVGLHSIVPPDAFTAETLGTERAGNGVLIDDGLVLTIGYLITEAESVWLHLGDGRVMEGHALGFDSESGFGLVQALGRPGIEPLRLGSSAATKVGDRVVVGGAGGRTRSVASQIVAKQEFAGYWEYLLDEA